MRNISLFKNFTKEIGSRTLSQIVEEIRGNHYKDAISKIRELVKSGDQEKVNRLKKVWWHLRFQVYLKEVGRCRF